MSNKDWEKNGSPFEKDWAKMQGISVQEMRERSRTRNQEARDRKSR